MQRTTIKTIGATLVIVGAVVFLYFTMTPSAPIINPKPFEALGQTAAEEAHKWIGNGGRVALISRDTRLFPSPHMDYMRGAFLKYLRQLKISVLATNLLKEDPLRAARVPPADYQELLQKLTDKDVIVSFLGPPILSPEQKKKLPEKGPKVVALCTGSVPRQVNLKELFAENLLQTAIISRPNPETVLPKNGNLRTWFDHFYLIVTSANLNDLPGPADTPNR